MKAHTCMCRYGSEGVTSCRASTPWIERLLCYAQVYALNDSKAKKWNKFWVYLHADGFIFVGTNFRGLNKIDNFVGFKICGFSIFIHNLYRKLPFHGYWNSWIRPSMKTTKIGTPRNLSHPQYIPDRGPPFVIVILRAIVSDSMSKE